MPKDTKSSGNNKAPACESRGFGHKKEGENFDTPSCLTLRPVQVGFSFDLFFICLFVFIINNLKGNTHETARHSTPAEV